MSDRYDDSDSSWEFVGKDSSDSEDDNVRFGRVRHDTGLPESVLYDIKLPVASKEDAKLEADSDIEVCVQDDATEENSEVATDFEVETMCVTETTGNDALDGDLIIETVDSESDVEKIEDNGILHTDGEDVQSDADEPSPTPSAPGSTTDSQTCSKYMGFNIVDSTETVVSVDGKEDKSSYLKVEEKSSQTEIWPMCDASVATNEVHVVSTASETDVIQVANASHSIMLAAIFITALGIGFSLGAMYGPLHNVMPRNTSPGHQFQTSHSRRTVEQNIHSPDNSLPLDSFVDLKSRLSKRSISVNQLKGRISKLRMENEKLKSNIKLATNQHLRDQQMQNYYKTMALHQEQVVSKLEAEMQDAMETHKRRMQVKQNKLRKKTKEIARYKRHHEYVQMRKISPPFYELAIQTLYEVLHNKTNDLMHLRYELKQTMVTNVQEKLEYERQEAILRKRGRLCHLRTKLHMIRIVNQSPKKSLIDRMINDKVDNPNNYINQSQCVFEKLKIEEPITKLDSPSKLPPTYTLNLSVPLFEDISNAVLVPDFTVPFPNLHKLFLSAISSKEDDTQISYVPSIYYDHAVRMQGVCRLNIRKLQRNAYMLLLKNKYANTQLTHTLQQSSLIQQELEITKQAIFDLKKSQENSKHEEAVCKPTLKQCVSTIINTTAIQPYVNFTIAKRAVNHFTRELNRSAVHAWNKIVQKVQKMQTKLNKNHKFDKPLYGAENKNKKHAKKEHHSPRDRKNKFEKKNHRTNHGKAFYGSKKYNKHGKRKWWNDQHKNIKDKSEKMFKKIHKTVKKAVSKGGEKVGNAIGTISHHVTDKGNKIKHKAQEFYMKHKEKPIKYFEKAKKFGGLVIENIYNVTEKLRGPLPEETIYCPGSSSPDKGCSHNVNEFQTSNDPLQDNNKNTDMWYLKRYEERERERNQEETCESEDWYFKRQEVREILRAEEEERRDYDEMLKYHINAANKKQVDDDDDFDGWRSSIDEMVYFNFPNDKKDDRVLYPNY